MKRLLLLLCILLLAQSGGYAAADVSVFDGRGLDDVLFEYIDAHELNEDNFAMGWLDLTSGETWYFQPDRYMVAGSMYKLPLNMAVADKLAAGAFSPDDIVGGYQISVAQTLSIVYSDNDAANALEAALAPDHTAYRELIAAYSGIPVEDLPDAYYTDNCISPRFMIGTLQTLYENSLAYETLIRDLKAAHPGRYFQSTQSDYEIAHKYGYYEGALADCGIVYTPRPFALVVFLSGSAARETVLGELCALMTDYALYLETLPPPMQPPLPTAPPASAAVTAAPTDTPAPEPSPLPGQNAEGTRNTVAAVTVFAAAALLVRFFARQKK